VDNEHPATFVTAVQNIDFYVSEWVAGKIKDNLPKKARKAKVEVNVNLYDGDLLVPSKRGDAQALEKLLQETTLEDKFKKGTIEWRWKPTVPISSSSSITAVNVLEINAIALVVVCILCAIFRPGLIKRCFNRCNRRSIDRPRSSYPPTSSQGPPVFAKSARKPQVEHEAICSGHPMSQSVTDRSGKMRWNQQTRSRVDPPHDLIAVETIKEQ